VKLPTLYKKTSNGKIEQWTVEVLPLPPTYAHVNDMLPDDHDPGYGILTEYGHVGGKLQTAQENVHCGKNLGKANATTAKEQAESQAKAEWTTKLTRKGYTDDLKKAERGENEGAGGIRPMLAKDYADHAAKIKFPCAVQPKLDGIRCIAVVEDVGRVTLWSREQKPIVAVPSIAAAIDGLMLPPGTVLDGELYNHDLKDDFETISSCVRKQYAASDEDQALIQYHIYDLPRHPGLSEKAPFKERNDKLYHILIIGEWEKARLINPKLHYVDTYGLIEDEAELIHYRTLHQKNGYEGAMARNLGSPYEEGKRSYNLQKLKEFLEDDFEIVGVKEGVGKMAGLAIFECKAQNGNLFSVKLEGSLQSLAVYLNDESQWQGKKLTVKYFALTNKNKVPRFPVGKAVRDYE
jgi:DNA ligase-1